MMGPSQQGSIPLTLLPLSSDSHLPFTHPNLKESRAVFLHTPASTVPRVLNLDSQALCFLPLSASARLVVRVHVWQIGKRKTLPFYLTHSLSAQVTPSVENMLQTVRCYSLLFMFSPIIGVLFSKHDRRCPIDILNE